MHRSRAEAGAAWAGKGLVPPLLGAPIRTKAPKDRQPSRPGDSTPAAPGIKVHPETQEAERKRERPAVGKEGQSGPWAVDPEHREGDVRWSLGVGRKRSRAEGRQNGTEEGSVEMRQIKTLGIDTQKGLSFRAGTWPASSDAPPPRRLHGASLAPLCSWNVPSAFLMRGLVHAVLACEALPSPALRPTRTGPLNSSSASVSVPLWLRGAFPRPGGQRVHRSCSQPGCYIICGAERHRKTQAPRSSAGLRCRRARAEQLQPSSEPLAAAGRRPTRSALPSGPPVVVLGAFFTNFLGQLFNESVFILTSLGASQEHAGGRASIQRCLPSSQHNSWHSVQEIF